MGEGEGDGLGDGEGDGAGDGDIFSWPGAEVLPDDAVACCSSLLCLLVGDEVEMGKADAEDAAAACAASPTRVGRRQQHRRQCMANGCVDRCGIGAAAKPGRGGWAGWAAGGGARGARRRWAGGRVPQQGSCNSEL